MSGLRFLRSAGMEGSTGNLREFVIDPANADAIHTGDLVRLASGLVVEASGAANNNDFAVLGVFQGCKYTEADGSIKYANRWDGVAGRTGITAFVAIPTGCTFLIRGTAGQAYVQADIGVRKGIVWAAGNTMTGQSGITLGAAGATVGTGPLLVQSEVSLADGNRWFEVSIVRDQLNLIAA